MARYAITIFLSAFLLFQVQPLIGKFILPWFGGSPAVWTTCMLFFQVVLLGGYSYAHAVTMLSVRALRVVHVGLLAVSLALLGVLPVEAAADIWKPTGAEAPILHILALLAVTIGLPYFLLSTTGPLLQEAFHRETGHTPYRLYSLSNIGSLLALLTYPFLFEPQLKLHTQIVAWSLGYAAFVACCAWCALRFTAGGAASAQNATAAGPVIRPKWHDVLLWLSLAACGSVMLLATTNQLCQEISSVPFLWVVPLALYLLSFIICFDHERWYHRNTFLMLLCLVVLLICGIRYLGNRAPMWYQLAAYSITLFICCMVCHGELVKSRPAPRYATLFYLMVSAGGALGGIFVAVVAPMVFRDYWEYHVGIAATIVLAFIIALLRQGTGTSVESRSLSVVLGSVAVALLVAIGISAYDDNLALGNNLETSRNFYGVLRVNEEGDETSPNGAVREMIHGHTQHGIQYLDPVKRHWATTYYGPSSGVGMAIDYHPRRKAEDPAERTLRIGVVGLGCGTLAAYGDKGDYIRFYEINPEVLRLSDKYFTYRQDSPAEVEVVLGDARINMERELAAGNPQRFDVLAVDAFSSDSIPMHLLTVECVELYRKHLKPDGLLCIHISNRFLDLSGVVYGIAKAVGCECVFIDATSDPEIGVNVSTWGIITTNEDFLNDPEVRQAVAFEMPPNGKPIVWTDDYGSLWQVLEPQRGLFDLNKNDDN